MIDIKDMLEAVSWLVKCYYSCWVVECVHFKSFISKNKFGMFYVAENSSKALSPDLTKKSLPKTVLLTSIIGPC